jgi:hypothetical protein
MLTIATCKVPLQHLGTKSTGNLGECVTEHGRSMCARRGGECMVVRDGYYLMSVACVMLGAGLLAVFILPTVRRLQCKSDLKGKGSWANERSAADERVEGQDPALRSS